MLYENENHNSWSSSAVSKDDQERAVRLSRLCTVYGQHDRVITGDAINVHIAPGGPAPAWSDGQEIFINADQVTMMDIESLVQVNGLNYHELAHQMFTPRRGSNLVEWVAEHGYYSAFNILEDQRIETLLIGKYPSIVPYLTATIVRWLAKDMESLMGNYICVRGRRYLPVELRTTFRDAFAFPHLIPTVQEVVDQYRALAFPRDFDTAKGLIERFHQEVVSVMMGPDVGIPGLNPQSFGGPNNCGRRNPVDKGRPASASEQAKIQQRGSQIGTPEPEYKPKSEGNTGASSDGSNANNDPADLERQQREELDRREEGLDSPPSKTPGNVHSPSVGGLPDKIAEIAEQTIADVLNRKDVKQDIKVKQKAIVGSYGRYSENLPTGRHNDAPVPDSAVVAYRHFAKELQRLKQECEPAWDKETPSGRLNVQRVIRGCEIDQAFDRWDEGNDGTDLEAVILIDRSGSMSFGGNDRLASIAAWTIKRAMESIDCPATVYSFDTEPELAYRGDVKVDKTQYKFIYGSGGTEPYEALINAERLLLSSRRKNKILFIITDGAFYHERNDELIERMARKGVLTALCLIDNSRDPIDKSMRHGCEVFGRIASALELVPFAKSVVIGAVKKRMGRTF